MRITERLAARQGEARANRPVLIAFLGDSVTHGCFEVFLDRHGKIDTACRPEKGYPALVQARLVELYPAAAVSILNAGVSGDSALGGLNRLERDVLSFSPDLVVVNFALNDCMNPDVEGGLRGYERAMRGIFEGILNAGAEAMLLTPNFMCDYVAADIREELFRDIAAQGCERQNGGALARYADAARGAAAALNVPVADAHARWQAMKRAGVDTTALLSNGINHPTEGMHRLFSEEILRAMFEGGR